MAIKTSIAAIQDAINIGVPSFADDQREYLEIAVVACIFRPVAKATRLVELIHRAIPYPVLLLTLSGDALTVSAAHKRRAQNEAGRFVIEVGKVSSRARLQIRVDDRLLLDESFKKNAERPFCVCTEFRAQWRT